MGTNYYLRKAIRPSKLKELKDLVTEDSIYNGTLQEALEEFNEIHIGKSSCGWQFCFDHNNWQYYDNSRQSVNAFLQRTLDDGGLLFDEYLEPVTLNDFWRMVDDKKDGFNAKSYYEYELRQWQRYLSNPEEFGGCLKPPKPRADYLTYPEIIGDDGLRFACSTDFC